MIPNQELFPRYQDLQRYVGWRPEDAQRMRSLLDTIRPSFDGLIDDFYAEIARHDAARRVVTGGESQIARLKQSLRGWLEDLFSGDYDAAYVRRRWNVGLRHVEIGLDQIYTNAALSRLRQGLVAALSHDRPSQESAEACRSLNMLIDLDLAIIEDAYQTEYAARLQRIERLATLGQVSGGIAHELRNPLNVVKTSVYFLLNARHLAPEKLTEHLQRIERQVGLADRVITALADFSRLPLPQLRPLPLAPCLQESLQETPLPPQVRVRLECPPNVPAVLGDIDQLQIAFGNLFRNARDAMPHGGLLGIDAREEGAFVAVDICDDGVGISAEHLERIMEPLYSTKSRGLGLGLAITRAIIEKHQGQLRVQSQLGQGSRFTVRLVAAT
ncbi:MAG: sensor histidine kinase [Pirellulales bacterium]